MSKHIIWSNYDLNLEDWREDLTALLEENGIEDVTDDMLYQEMVETNDLYLEDERENLDIRLTNPMLVIGDIGRWNGRFSGYRRITTAKLSDILYTGCDYATWYVDDEGDLRANCYHHDGVNHYLYREYREDVDEVDMDELESKIYLGIFTEEDLDRYTAPVGHYAAKVYGWEMENVEGR